MVTLKNDWISFLLISYNAGELLRDSFAMMPARLLIDVGDLELSCRIVFSIEVVVVMVLKKIFYKKYF
jgi:hypothetical protein